MPAISTTSADSADCSAVAIARRAVGLDEVWGAAEAGAQLGNDRGRILVARVVAGQDQHVRMGLRSRSHGRALARVAVAAGAEHAPESAAAAFREWPQRLQRVCDRIRRMRIVDHRERLSAIRRIADHLQPARHRPQLLQLRRHFSKRPAQCEPDACHRQYVALVEASDQRQSQVDAVGAGCFASFASFVRCFVRCFVPASSAASAAAARAAPWEPVSAPGSRLFVLLRERKCVSTNRSSPSIGVIVSRSLQEVDRSPASASGSVVILPGRIVVDQVADPAQVGVGGVEHLGGSRIFQVDHHRHQCRPGEQPGLCRGVGLHRHVIVEMVARQVGEYRDRDARAVEPPLLQPDRRSLHRDQFHAAACEGRELLLQADRVRCRERRRSTAHRERPRRACRSPPPWHRCNPPAPSHRPAAVALRDPVGAAGLAVGTGDRHHRQPGGRLVEIGRGDLAGTAAQPLDLQRWRVRLREQRLECFCARLLDDDRTPRPQQAPG